MSDGKRKLEFDVTEEDFLKLQQAAKEMGKEIPEYFVDSISLMMVLQEQKKKGFDKVLIKNESSGQIAEIMMP